MESSLPIPKQARIEPRLESLALPSDQNTRIREKSLRERFSRTCPFNGKKPNVGKGSKFTEIDFLD